MQADTASPSGTWWSNGSGARFTLCWWQRQAGQKVFHSHDAQSLDGDGCDSQMLLFVRELNASTACSLSRVTLGTDSTEAPTAIHILFRAAAAWCACSQPHYYAEQGADLETPAAAQGKHFSAHNCSTGQPKEQQPPFLLPPCLKQQQAPDLPLS